MKFTLNNKIQDIDVEADMPLLWTLRDVFGLTGTRYGCGQGLCGACTVHVDGQAVRSCTLPISAVENRSVTTIEGLSTGKSLHPVQQAWVEADVPQCGFCQSGQIMQAAALLEASPNPSEAEIDQAMSGILCRCGTYVRIRRAIEISVVQMNRSDA